MNHEELRRIAASVATRRGWDFASMRTARDPVPWDYPTVARAHLRPTSRVLDIGTGGGEKFLSLAPSFGTGVGLDASAEMIATARENLPATLFGKVSFAVMPAESLQFPAASFDVVLNRHAPLDIAEAVRVLRPGGLFLTQQVGARNTRNICSVFGCDPGGAYPDKDQSLPSTIAALGQVIREAGCAVTARGEYDVRYWFLDVASLLFWLQAIPLPHDFALERHWRQVDRIIAACGTQQGLETNEHRELLIARKP